MRAEPDTDADTELEILAKLVGAYEDKHFPIAAPDPVENKRR
jgi:antitoxin component HigA of HigAB toxin-antitoxin module